MRTESRVEARRAGRRRIAERYRLGDRIGRGGMATVYRATDEQLDREVAVKVMRAELGEDTRFVRRFTGEARRAASVGHPNVVAVYDVGVDPRPYIVMELVEGGDLASRLRRERRMDPIDAARLVADAADAVAAAHAAGLVHRDVKPGNILVGTDGRAMVADFGIARATGEESLTRTGAALGSVDYFSPEQARGERAGPASDVYALGVVLYELLTGRRPFTGDTPYAVATARLGVPAPDPRRTRPDVPTGLADVVTAAMAPEPADRPTAAALANRLRAWVASVGVPATPIADGAADPAPASASLPVADAPAAAPRPEAGTDRRRLTPILLLAAAVVGLGGIGYLVGMVLDGDGSRDAPPGITLSTPGGAAIANATPSPSPSPSPTPSPSPSPTPPPSATAIPATPAPAPSRPAATPPPAQATPAPVVAGAPDDAVAAFYSYVAAGRFDEAYALWSDRMRAEYPRQENLDGRFADTADITFSALYVAEQTSSRATVQANFTETYDSGSSRDFVGYWRLVRVGGRWLLDEPTY